MTEIPEHLRKRAEEARKKAAAAAGGSEEPAGDAPAAAAAPAAEGEAAAPSAAASRIPAHLLERSKAAKAAAGGGGGEAAESGGGGGTAVATAPAAATTAVATAGVPVAAGPGGHTQRLLTVEVRLDPGREVRADRQGARLAAPARGRVRGCAGRHRVRVPAVGVRERAAADARQHQPHAEPVEGPLVLPRPPGAAHDVPPDGRGCDH